MSRRSRHDLTLISRGNVITCQCCGGATIVSDTSPIDRYGFTTSSRKRVCTKCGEHYRTIEVTTEHYNNLIAVQDHLAAITSSLSILRKHFDATQGE